LLQIKAQLLRVGQTLCMTKSNPATQILYDWWQNRRGERAMPARAELDPVELKSILPDLVLIDVRPVPGGGPGHAFAYRLAGTEIDSRFGIRLTGLTVEQLPFGDAGASIRQQYETAVREKRPVSCSHRVVVGGERYVEYERLVVPLSGDGPDVVTALAAAVDFRCAFGIDQGRPPYCSGQVFCDRIDLCLGRSRHS
jgi:hypothetical protein